MSTASRRPAVEVAPLPERGVRVFLERLPGSPWATVVEGRRDEVILVAPPRRDGREVPLPVGCALTIAYAVREVPYEVDAELVEAPPREGSGAYAARVTGPARRIQRRGAVRVPVRLIAHASAGGPESEPASAVAENLSAGGALLRTARPHPVGGSLDVALQCGGAAGTIRVTGRIVRCDREPGAARPWRVAVAFLDLAPAEEDRLVRFVFERQREIRRRELGLD